MRLYFYIALVFFLTATSSNSFGQFGGMDCSDATVICNANQVIYEISGSIPGPGKTNEAKNFGSCFKGNEFYPFFYTFTTASSGSFELKISPFNGPYNNLDFVLFDVTDGCESINSTKVISCNIQSDCQTTGISTTSMATWLNVCGYSDNIWNPTVFLDSGKTYLLFIHTEEPNPLTFQVEFNFNNLPDAVQFADVKASLSADRTTICAGESINFTNTSTYPRMSSFSWDFGDGETATTVNASHQYNTPGTYDAVLRVYNASCGDSDTLVQIEVVPALVPSFTSSSLCLGDTAVFTSTSQGNPTTLNWNFGAGANPATASGPGPHQVFYSTSGPRDITLSIENGICAVDTIQTVTISPLPIVTASSSEDTICSLENITLSAVGATNYSWFIEGNPTSLGSGTPVNTNPASTLNYVVIGTDDAGCQNSDTLTAIVNPLPTATISGSKPQVCANESITLTVNFDAPFTPAASNGYSFDNGTSFQDKNSFTIGSVTNDSTVTVIVIDNNGCVSNPIPYTIDVIPALQPSFTSNNACARDTVTLTNTSTGNPTDFIWTFGADASPANANTSGPHKIVYATNGTKTVSLTIDNALCDIKTLSQNITVFELPPVSASVADNTLCEGESTTLTGSGANAYSWHTVADPLYSLSNAISFTNTPTTTTNYVVVGTGANNCTNSDTVQVVVNPLPTATIASDKAEVCFNESITLTASLDAPFVPAATNAYSFDGGVTFQNGNTFTIPSVKSDTTIQVLVVDINGCRSTLITHSIESVPALQADFTFSNGCIFDNITFTNTSAGNPTDFAWDFGAASSPATALNTGPHSVSYSTSGTKTISLTISKTGCNSSTVSHNVTVHALPAVTATASTDTSCSNSLVTLSATGANSYEWFVTGTTPSFSTSNPVDLNPASTTEYVVTGIDGSACRNSDTITVTVRPLPTATVTSSPLLICQGQSVTITAELDAPFVPSDSNPYSFDGGNTFQSSNTYLIPFVDSDSIVSVIVEDSYNCLSIQTPVSINTVSRLVADFIFNDTCIGGTVTLTNTSAGNPTDFAWDFGTGSSPSNSTAEGPHTINYDSSGPKTVTLTIDNEVCDPSTISKIVQIFDLPAVSITTSSDTTCSGSPVTLNASGANIYRWYDLSNPSDLFSVGPAITVNSPATRSYSVVGVDGNGCQNSDSTTITVFTTPTATAAASSSTICEGESITVTVNFDTGHTPAATGAYSFDNGNTFQDTNSYLFSAINSDTTINVVVVNNSGCPGMPIPVIITTLPRLIPEFTFSDGCVNNPISLTNTSTGNPTSFTWDFGTDVAPQNSTDEGPHNIVWDAPGVKTITLTAQKAQCGPQSVTHTLEIYPLPTITASAAETEICRGQTISLNSVGGDSYSWHYEGDTTTVSSSSPFTDIPLPDDTNFINYIVEGTDMNGCTNTDTLFVKVNPIPVGYSIDPDLTCPGGNTNVTLNFEAPYVPATTGSYSFDGGITWQDTDTYTVVNIQSDTIVNGVIRDVNGCLSLPIDIPIPLKKFNASISTVSSNCFNGTDGSITITNVTGGVSPYQFAVNSTPFQTGNSFSGLAEGSYSISILDAEGCRSDTIVQITEPDSLFVNVFSKTDIICSGAPTGQVTVQAFGGIGKYSYRINNGTWQTENTFFTLPAGNHSIDVQDENACIASTQVILKQPVPLTISIVEKRDVNCYSNNDGYIKLSANGGTLNYSYSLDGINYTPADTFTNLIAGAYNAYVRDANGCSANLPVSIVQPDTLISTHSINQFPGCKDPLGIIAITGTSGGSAPYSYSINGVTFGSGTVFSDLLPGSHVIRTRDANNCISSLPVLLPGSSRSATAEPVSAPVTCNGDSNGSVSLINVTGGIEPYLFSINDTLSFQASSSFQDLGSGTYPIFIKTTEGCISQYSVNVAQPALLKPNVISFDDHTCFGSNSGSITVRGTGGNSGYEYRIDSGAYTSTGTFNNLSKGNHLIELRDNKGCYSSYAFSINELDSIYASVIETEMAHCNSSDGAAIVDSVSGGLSPYRFSIDNGNSFQTSAALTSLPSGVHSLIVQDAKGCTNTFRYIINQENGLNLSSINDSVKHLSCYNSNQGAIFLSNITGGQAPYQFALNNGSLQSDSTFMNLGAATHTIRIRDNNGCDYYYNVVLKSPGQIDFTLTVTSVETCDNEDGTILASAAKGGLAPYTYRIFENGSWSEFQSESEFSDLSAGNYTVEVKDNSGPGVCSVSKPITIGRRPGPQVYLSVSDVVCFGEENGLIKLDSISGGIPPYSFSIDTGKNFISEYQFADLKADIYSLLVKDAQCTYQIGSYYLYNENTLEYDTIRSRAIIVSQPAALVATPLLLNSSINSRNGVIGVTGIAGGTAPYSYSTDNAAWHPVSGDSVTISNLSRGTYSFYLNDANGCQINFDMSIEIPFFIPNLITPNGDGKNDDFEILSLPYKSKLVIVNKWGSTIYKSNNYDNSFNGEDQPDGVYYYNVELPDGREFKGWVEIIRN